MKNGFFRKLMVLILAVTIPFEAAGMQAFAEEEAEHNYEDSLDVEDWYFEETSFDPLLNSSIIDDSCRTYDALPDSEYYWWGDLDTAERFEMLAKYEAAVAEILAQIDSSWTDEQKVVFLHDYVASHAQYALLNGQPDHSDSIVQSAYGNIVNHRSVCDGYARAFYDLADRIGIEVYYISSAQLNHSWNLVVLNGKHYYVDTTWDGQPDSDGDAKHTYCLKSETYFKENGHDTSDWYISSYANVGVENSIPVNGLYNDTEYDNADWTGSECPMIQRNGYTICFDRGIKKFTGLKSNPVVIKTKTDGSPFVFSKEIGNKILLADYHKLYVYDLAQNTFTESPVSNGYNWIYRAKVVGSNIVFYIHSNGYSGETNTLALNLQPYISEFPVSPVSLSDYSHIFNAIGENHQLPVTTGTGTAIRWESSDTSVATVSNGKVTCVGAGGAYIKGYYGSHQIWYYVVLPQITPAQNEITIDYTSGTRLFKVAVNVTPDNRMMLPFDTLHWGSSDDSVVTVGARSYTSGYRIGDLEINGICENYINVRKTGSSVITATTVDGKYSTTFTVNVIAPLQRIKIATGYYDRDEININAGSTWRLGVTPTPSYATGDMTPVWTSSDTTVATVSSNGTVTGIKAGTATITANIQGKTSSVRFVVIENTNNNNGSNNNSGSSNNSGSNNNNSGNNSNGEAGYNENNNNGNNNNGNNNVSRTILMFRLYNPNSGEHLYTSDQNERRTLVAAGWRDEGKAWESPTYSNTPVYRLYNHNSGEHHYTKDWNEVVTLYTIHSGNYTGYDILNQGWDYEGIGWYSSGNDGKPLYRLYNPNAKGQFEPGSHHYTNDINERNTLISIGWNQEGIGWYSN